MTKNSQPCFIAPVKQKLKKCASVSVFRNRNMSFIVLLTLLPQRGIAPSPPRPEEMMKSAALTKDYGADSYSLPLESENVSNFRDTSLDHQPQVGHFPQTVTGMNF